MERGFYNEDIEELLKEKADQYKMYPSDKVWKGIHRSLHHNRRWYWLSLMIFLSAIGYYTFIEFITPSSTSKVINGNNPSSTLSKPTNAASQPKAVIVPFGTPDKQNSSNNTADPTGNQRTFVLNPDNSTDNTEPVIAPDQPIPLAITPPANSNSLAFNSETPVYDIGTGRVKKDWHLMPADQLPILAANDNDQTQAAITGAASLAHSTAVDASKLAGKQNEQEDHKRINWVQNLAVYELQVTKMKRLSWQLAFTPTMNYRTLKGSSSSDIKTFPLAPTMEGDLNKLVNHKPALGFELGSNLLYTVNRTLVLKGGLQFNYIRYDIQAYSSYAFEQATILAANPITTYTRYRNFGGDAVQNLHNQFFQLSIPVGLEVTLLGNHRLQIGIAGTLQPTYLLNRNMYLITTDYKYATESSLVRKWNLNSTAEAFISYKTGDLKWQVGPQFRYQLLSNYVKEYPIREHLMEYGIKIGVAKTIR